jgi:hypothetical protein
VIAQATKGSYPPTLSGVREVYITSLPEQVRPGVVRDVISVVAGFMVSAVDQNRSGLGWCVTSSAWWQSSWLVLSTRTGQAWGGEVSRGDWERGCQCGA